MWATLLAILLAACLRPVAVGEASYYTVASSGTVTASGEPMRDDRYTCAMRTGELGRWLLVVADNGRAVVCRQNDRGPYVDGRVIDLRRAFHRGDVAFNEIVNDDETPWACGGAECPKLPRFVASIAEQQAPPVPDLRADQLLSGRRKAIHTLHSGP